MPRLKEPMIVRILVGCFFLICCSLHADLTMELQYEIRPAQESYLCEVHLHIPNVKDSNLVLQIPKPEEETIIFNLQNAQTGNSLLPDQTGSVTVSPNEKGSVDVLYQVGAVSKQAAHWFSLPQGNKTYFHLFGDHLFVHPKMELTRSIEVNLSWQGWPEHWVIANSLGIQASKQKFTGSLDAFLTTIFVGGDFQIFKGKGSPPIFLVTREPFLSKASNILETAEKIILTQRAFWNDFDFPSFLISVLPLGSAEVACGRGLYNSFSLCLNDYVFEHPEEQSCFIGHEHFHTWNGIKITPQPADDLIWFSEGFTEYYTHKLNLRSGVTDEAEYVKRINLIISKYFKSPVKNYTNLQIKQEKSLNNILNDVVYDIAYHRGALLAAYWDKCIQDITNCKFSLDDVMINLKHKSHDFSGTISQDAIIQCVSQFLGSDATDHIEKFMIQGKEFIPPEDLMGSNYQLLWIEAIDSHPKDQILLIPQFFLKE